MSYIPVLTSSNFRIFKKNGPKGRFLCELEKVLDIRLWEAVLGVSE